jgi:branched-chain amino acid aminotransferase
MAAGYDDALWLDQHGHVAEAAASNVFLVKKHVLYTPRSGILRGITRQTFIELAQAAGVEVRETDLTAFDLYVADEVFTTSTAGGALAVREVMGRQIRGPVPGPVTRRLDADYWAVRESGRHGTPVY